MSKQLKTNNEFDEVTEADLSPQEVSIEELTKEELIKLCNDKDKELDNYKTVLNGTTMDNKNLRQMYNEDMTYLSTVNSNVLKIHRKKEDAITNIINGALTLLTIDRDEIAPDRKEEN